MIAMMLLATVTALTPYEAQTLPVSELAQRVLGAAGAVVVDVERPTWPVLPAQNLPVGLPALTYLTFYTHASATSEAGWLGLCQAAAIDISFGKDGTVTDMRQRPTIGWIGALTHQPSASGAIDEAALSKQYSEFNARCQALPTTRRFASYFAPRDGERALIGVAMVHDSMLTSGSIRVTCTIDMFFPQTCGTRADLKRLAEDVAVDKVTDINQISARDSLLKIEASADDICYSVRLNQSFGSSDQVDMCMRVGATITVTRAAFIRGRVVY
ncbi:hypothetical protein WG907_05215 [Sphingobium sp. AN558]|uniref:hypothetical protein n=1 Tax=Sphingobium sp. AN558 TaxID=3133442 RepID=UPI0030BA75BC